jgi:cytoskeleton protein RodZ
MESIGLKLRQARLRAGLTLEEISSTTRISLNYLRAIEADDLDQIGSRFFYASFVRQFAAALKLDDAAFVAALDSAMSHLPAPLAPGEPGTPVPPHLSPLRPTRTRTLRWAVSVGSLAAVLVACSGVYSFWQNYRYELMPSFSKLMRFASERRSAESKPADSVRHSDEKSPVADGTGPNPPGKQPGATEAEPSGVRLEVSALERTWLSVFTDGRQVYNGILQASETKELDGQKTARVRTGNAGGIAVVFNGKTIGTLGPKGQVRTAVFTKDRYTILEPSARFALSEVTLGLP